MSRMNQIYSPQEIFTAFLIEENSRGRVNWKRYGKKMHRAFGDAKIEFPSELSCYEISQRIPSYSPTLDEMYLEFGRAGILYRENGTLLLKDASSLNPNHSLEPIVKCISDRLDELFINNSSQQKEQEQEEEQ